ncbi:MAG TPA: Uma2 family endonuclease [Methylocystis sp.]|nr:Uma2 family endonuclease [Methylocystis sp.]
MPVLAEKAMTVEEFLGFAAKKSGKWELVDGQALAMSPGRVVHGDLKYRIARALDAAIARAKIPCRFVLDSAAVKIDSLNSFQPDAMIYCGAPLPPDAFFVPNPTVVVEIPSLETSRRDSYQKLAGYFKVKSVAHYLIVSPDGPLIIHHQRRGDDVLTRIFHEGTIRLDPPGMEVSVEEIYGNPA